MRRRIQEAFVARDIGISAALTKESHINVIVRLADGHRFGRPIVVGVARPQQNVRMLADPREPVGRMLVGRAVAFAANVNVEQFGAAEAYELFEYATLRKIT